MFSLFAFSMWYTVVNPHLWIYTCVAALLRNDLPFPHTVSVENFPFSHLTPYCLYTLYLLLIGSIADLFPLCNVTFISASAISNPIPNQSDRTSADILECISFEDTSRRSIRLIRNLIRYSGCQYKSNVTKRNDISYTRNKQEV